MAPGGYAAPAGSVVAAAPPRFGGRALRGRPPAQWLWDRGCLLHRGDRAGGDGRGGPPVLVRIRRDGAVEENPTAAPARGEPAGRQDPLPGVLAELHLGLLQAERPAQLARPGTDV